MFDTLMSTRSTLEALASSFEPTTLTGAQAVRVLAELGLIRRLTDGMIGRAAKRVEDTSAHAASGARDAAHLFARVVGADSAEGRRVITTAKRLEKLPATAAAVARGCLSARQAELVADAATHNPRAEGTLLTAAREGMVPLRDACVRARAEAEDSHSRAKRQRAARGFRMWTASDGMVQGHFSLTPEVGGGIKALIDDETQRIFRAHRKTGQHESHSAYAADAFANLINGKRENGETPKRAAPTVYILVDHAVIVRGEACPGETCEIAGIGPVDAAWVKEILGEAFLAAVIKKGRDITTVAHLGRHVPAELLTAMIAGGRECDVVGCHGRAYLERDHSEVDYAKGGPTAWWNLAWLCSVHHKRKTSGWILGPRDPHNGRRTLTPPPAITRT
jgi:hypothetical protein